VAQQHLRSLGVGGLEVAEEPDAVAVELVVQPVAARTDAADDRARATKNSASACAKNGFLRGSICQASALASSGTKCGSPR
jgi:hypothetical protein